MFIQQVVITPLLSIKYFQCLEENILNKTDQIDKSEKKYVLFIMLAGDMEYRGQ